MTGNTKAVGVAFSDPILSGGTIDNTVIGGTTAAAITGTVVTASTSAALTSPMIGASATDTVGFFGTTKAVQPTSGNEAAVLTVAAVTVAGYSFVTAGQANGIVTLLNQLRADLVTLGLIKGS